VCAVASLVFVAVSVKDAGSLRRTELWGWTKDSLESGDGKISAEEVEQLNSVLDAQDNLKKNLQRMAEKLDKGRGTEIAVEQGHNSPAGPDGERGADGPKGPPGPSGVMGPQGAVGKEGLAGMKGAQGTIGPPGSRGPPGQQGEIGPFGMEGPKGNMGAVGYPGPPGASGPQGPMGPEQPNMAGPAGPMGPLGPFGPEGPNGEVGPRGQPGQAAGPQPPPIIYMPPAPPVPPLEPISGGSGGGVLPPITGGTGGGEYGGSGGEGPMVGGSGGGEYGGSGGVLPPDIPGGTGGGEYVGSGGEGPMVGGSGGGEYGGSGGVLPPGPPVVEEEAMPAGARGLNMECGKWRDNSAGTGSKPDLSLPNQMKQMAYCMAQDCVQSLEEVTCRYTDPNRLCYTNVGQLFCAEHPLHSLCQDLGEEVTGANQDGPGTWTPLEAVPVFGSAAAAAPGPFSCVCLKNCAHYTGSSEQKKYRCTGGHAIKTGAVEGSPAATAIIKSSSKNGQCACSCGYTGNLESWEAQDAQ